MVTIHTVDIQQTDNLKIFEMSIRGLNGSINKILLKDYVKSDLFEITHEDVGDVRFNLNKLLRLRYLSFILID